MKWITQLLCLAYALTLSMNTLATKRDTQPLAGWNVLQNDFDPQHPLDIVSFEWEYFMIHDEKFNGIVGYVVANPREKLGDIIQIVPNGANVAFVGEVWQPASSKEKCFLWHCWQQEIPAGFAKPIADYHAFGTKGSEYSAEEKRFYATNAQGWYGQLTPMPNGSHINDQQPALHLSGKSEHFTWNLIVSQALVERDLNRHQQLAFTKKAAADVGIKGEEWTVDALWPKTNVTGTVTINATGETIDINGKGYRENSWGRYILPLDGWDFMVFSEQKNMTQTDENSTNIDTGVLMVMQTYHKSKELDFVDFSFYDNGTLINERFREKSFSWTHPTWKFDNETRSCVPLTTTIRLENTAYLIEANINIGERQRAMLSDATIGTSLFFIQEHFPTVTGSITRKSNNEVIHEFSGQAGGEFAYHKDLLPEHSDTYCNFWGWSKFGSE